MSCIFSHFHQFSVYPHIYYISLISVQLAIRAEAKENSCGLFVCVFVCFYLGATPFSSQGLLLTLHLGITPGRLRGSNPGWLYAMQMAYLLYSHSGPQTNICLRKLVLSTICSWPALLTFFFFFFLFCPIHSKTEMVIFQALSIPCSSLNLPLFYFLCFVYLMKTFPNKHLIPPFSQVQPPQAIACTFFSSPLLLLPRFYG